MQFYAFDILVSDGQDVSRLPLSIRTASLARLMARRVDPRALLYCGQSL